KEERASNVVASIPATAIDCEEGYEVEYIQKLARKLGVSGSKVVKARKTTRAKDKTAKNQVLLVVEIKSPGARTDMIRSPRKLRDDESHNRERHSRNDLLPESKTFNGRVMKFKTSPDGKKRFRGIRNRELKMIKL
ncbi:hypothetical protein BpHYR1_023883, partial [Brachionus plicatilis]